MEITKREGTPSWDSYDTPDNVAQANASNRLNLPTPLFESLEHNLAGLPDPLPAALPQEATSNATGASTDQTNSSKAALSSASVDLSKWTDQLLDRQAGALQSHLRRETYPGREGDVRELAQVESEIARRQKTDLTPQVELCARPAKIPVLEQLGAKHHWIRTTHVEAGMGLKGGGVPGKDSHIDLPYDPTTVNQHRGEGVIGADCTVVPDVDEACVERELEIGRDTGAWTPMNQCQTFAAEVLAKCGTKPPPAIVIPSRPNFGPKL